MTSLFRWKAAAAVVAQSSLKHNICLPSVGTTHSRCGSPARDGHGGSRFSTTAERHEVLRHFKDRQVTSVFLQAKVDLESYCRLLMTFKRTASPPAQAPPHGDLPNTPCKS
jgi:hypothetical protein